MSYSPACRVLLGCVHSIFLLTSAIAAPPLNGEFAVSAAQMQALGVTLVPLEKPAAIDGQAYPAHVVLPPGGEQLVSAPFSGMVVELLVEEQQPVKTGQALLRLSGPEFGDLQLKLLEAASKAKLGRKSLERERQLFAEGIIPERRVQEAEAADQEATARQIYAESSLRLAGVDPATIRKMTNGGGLQDELVVRAKSDGIVLSLPVKAGQRVQSSDALLRLVKAKNLWLDIQIPVGQQRPVPSRAGTPAITVVGRDVSATWVSLGATVSDNQTLTMRARVVRGAELLRPGEVVQVRVPFADNAQGWALPLQAIARQDDKAYVFVRTENGFQAQMVDVVSSAGQSVQVTGNLRAGQQVATGSVIALKAAWLGKSGSN